MSIKVLPLDRWMLESEHFCDLREDTLAHYTPTKPVFNRPGYYKWKVFPKAAACWFELEDGRAFLCHDLDFDYRLDLLHAEQYNARQVAALEAVVAQRVATKAQTRLLWKCREVSHLRRISRDIGKRRVAMRKKFESSRLKGNHEPETSPDRAGS